ncbi:MAG: hypothetical protein H7099_18180 [Gemmatimonadaceae bacterium]|nr:hypothetical protein [Gemmatimonadaceae bacterium]
MRIRLLTCVVLLAASTACDENLFPVDREIFVVVKPTGTGTGRVQGDSPTVGINCRLQAAGAGDSDCSSSFRDAGGGGRFELSATADPGSVFESWTGCSAVNGPVCVLAFEVGGPSQTFDVKANFRLLAPSPHFGTNLLQNPGFETPVTVGPLPADVGRWQGDSAASVASTIAVSAHDGARALRFITSGPPGVSLVAGVSSQQWQIVDLSSIASAIDSGNVLATTEAWFYRVAGGEATDDRFDLRLTSYRGVPAELPVSYVNPGGVRFHDDMTTVIVGAGVWTRASLDVLIPAGVRYLVVEIYAFENRVNDATFPEFAGHYADDVSLVLRRLP